MDFDAHKQPNSLLATKPAEIEEYWLTRPGQPRLFCRRWPVAASTAKTLLIVHGACEHGGKYLSLASKVQQAGWRVVLSDLRGHGRSEGDYVHVNRFEDYLHDLQYLCEHHQLRAENTVLLGCSMGGLISIRFNQWVMQQTGQPPCKALFLISPLLAIKHPVATWKKVVAGMISNWLPRTRFRSTIDPADLTHDQQVLQLRAEDSLIRQQVTARWFLETENAMHKAFADAALFQVPAWIYQAGEDRIVDPLATQKWAETVNQVHSRPLVQLELLEGWFHEILKETRGPEMEDRLLAQINAS